MTGAARGIGLAERVHAAPYDFVFPRDATALVVIDMQHEFCSEGGFASALGRDVSAARAIVPAVQQTVARARELGLRVLYTRESHRPDLSDCPAPKLERSRRAGAEIGGRGPLGRRLIRGEPGNQLIPEMDVQPQDVVLDKPGKGAFHATDLELVLRTLGITHLVFAGVSTNVCVHTSVREATDRGFWTLTLSDACAAYEPSLHEAGIAMFLTAGGIFGWVATVSDLTGSRTTSQVGGTEEGTS